MFRRGVEADHTFHERFYTIMKKMAWLLVTNHRNRDQRRLMNISIKNLVSIDTDTDEDVLWVIER